VPAPWYRSTLLTVLSILISACADVRYLAHVTHGQAQLVRERRPLDQIIAAPDTDTQLAARLALARDARRFASQHLDLPDNRSYTSYVDLHRPYVVWNVFAAPRYSVEPVLHCFPIAGCVPYRGYFDETRAKAEAARLQARGDDVFVGGVAAYSTLGWFADPILSSMLRWDDDELAGTIFHELAHQLIYVKDDTAFNESFASFVQQQGLREWRASRGLSSADEQRQRSDDEFVKLVLDLRERLRQLYASGGDKAAMEAGKQGEFEDFRARYRQWRDARSPNDHAHDDFVAASLNNAWLLPFGLYDRWVPAFAALFAQSDSQWPAFYARVRALAKLTPARRGAEMKALK
jgi:predicted aminopeptidase